MNMNPSDLTANWRALEAQTRQSPEFDAEVFTSVADGRGGWVYTVEVSDLAVSPGDGFWLSSERTGARAWFVLDRSERDDEGDLVSVHYRPANSTLLPSVEVIVWND